MLRLRPRTLRSRTRGRGRGRLPALLRLPGGWSLRRLAGGACGMLLAAGMLGASLEVRRHVHGDARHRLETWRIEVGELPGWVTPDIRAQIEAPPPREPDESWNLLDRGVLRRVLAAFETSPWIRRAEVARIAFPARGEAGSLSLALELRHPVAIIEHGRLYYLAGPEGSRLGAPYSAPPTAWFGVPVVAGVASPGPVPEPGSSWISRDIRQGVEVARILFESGVNHDFPERPVHVIDLSNLHGRREPRESEIVLWSGSQRLAWGRSPISSGPRTATVPEIVENLRHVLSHPETYGGYALIHLHRRREDLTGIRG